MTEYEAIREAFGDEYGRMLPVGPFGMTQVVEVARQMVADNIYNRQRVSEIMSQKDSELQWAKKKIDTLILATQQSVMNTCNLLKKLEKIQAEREDDHPG